MSRFLVAMPPRARNLGAGLLVVGLLLSLPVGAQEEEPEETNVVASLRFQVGELITQANTCLEEGDIECAQDRIRSIERIRDLNTYEEAQLYNFTVFLSVEIEDFDAAIAAYEKMLALPRDELPAGLIDTSMRNLSSLYLQQEKWEEGLAYYLEWLELPFVTPSPDDYALLGNIYYQMERWEDGIPAMQQAIDAAVALGEMPEENWYTLLYVFHFQLEQIPEVIDTLTILVENWTKRRHMQALAGQFSGQDRFTDTLVLYESMYESGFLESGRDWLSLASLYMNAEVPYKAAVLMEKGLNEGVIESTHENWRRLAQAWQMAQDYEKALPALETASSLAEDGQIDQMLGQSFIRLARWEDCVEATRSALDRGGLDEPAYAQIQLGTCLLNLREFQQARAAFVAASDDDNRRDEAQTFIRYVDEEMRRQRANEEALAALDAR